MCEVVSRCKRGVRLLSKIEGTQWCNPKADGVIKDSALEGLWGRASLNSDIRQETQRGLLSELRKCFLA